MFNQLSGINALLYYAPRVFELAGAGADSALLQSIAVGGTNLVFTVLAMFFIDRFGRKPLLFIGSIVTAASLFLVGYQLESSNPNGTAILAGLLGFIAAFALSQGAVIWVFISEVFPSAVRGKGQALGSTTHWIMAALITWTFPVFAASVGGWVFAFFGAMMLLQLLWTWKFMPETNGIALEEMDLRTQHA
jgi:MFS family permease